MKLTSKNLAKALTLCLSTTFLLMSCEKQSEEAVTPEGQEEEITVQVRMDGAGYQTISSETRQSAGNGTSSPSAVIEQKTIRLENNGHIVAELIAEEPTSGMQAKATTAGGTITQPVGAGYPYRLLVFDAKGNYVTEKNFVAGQSAKPFTLPAFPSRKYTFVAYQTPTNAAPKDNLVWDYTYNGSQSWSVKNIEGYQVEKLAGRNHREFIQYGIHQFAWWKKTLDLKPFQTTYLDIDMKFQTAGIAVIHDARGVGRKIQKVEGGWNDFHRYADYSLATGKRLKLYNQYQVGNHDFDKFIGSAIVDGLGTSIATTGYTYFHDCGKDASAGDMEYKARVTIDGKTETIKYEIDNDKLALGTRYTLRLKYED